VELFLNAIKAPVKKLLFILASCVCLLNACTSTKPSGNKNDASALSGTWELTDIEVAGIVFDSLYSGKKPTINFDLEAMTAGGSDKLQSFQWPGEY
jgi:hypothetical protein